MRLLLAALLASCSTTAAPLDAPQPPDGWTLCPPECQVIDCRGTAVPVCGSDVTLCVWCEPMCPDGVRAYCPDFATVGCAATCYR